MELEKLFERINLNSPGLEKAKALYANDKKEAALDEIIKHFRTREKPYYFSGEEDIAKYTDKDAIVEADEICRHNMIGRELGKNIDWRRNYTDSDIRDSEWMWSLARNLFWAPLARAYALTGDEKYAKEFVDQMKGFIEAWPVEEFIGKVGIYGEKTVMVYPGTAWRTIETGIRIYCIWIPLYYYFRKSPSMDRAAWVRYLNSLCDHAEFLTLHYTNHTRCSNWHTMECTALFQLGVLFPEFNNAAAWKDLGYRRVTHEVRFQFDHFGVHIERTPIYHLTAAGAFLQAYRIMIKNNIVAPPYMLPILEKTAEFLMRLVKPDFSTPMTGDADRNDLLTAKADTAVFEGMNNTTDLQDANEMRAFFRVMHEITGREDFLYFASGRKQGKPPIETCFNMNDPGYLVCRTGWGAKDSYFLVTGVNLELGESNAHAHFDAAHLELQVEGKDILIDGGRYLYTNSAWRDWRDYFRSTAAHNTVLVDDHSMGLVPDTPFAVRGVRTYTHRLESTSDYQVIEVSHNGYAFMKNPIFHYRRVLSLSSGLYIIDDQFTGYGEHDYRLYFNFAPGTLENTDALISRYTNDDVIMNVIPLLTDGVERENHEGSNEPKGGWVSYGYAWKMPIPQIVYKARAAAPARFITLFAQEGKAELVKPAKVSGEQVSFTVICEGKKITVALGTSDFKLSK